MSQVEWDKCKAHELRQLANDDAVVIIPVASIEQHGPHLPVQVDTRLAYEASRRAARLATERGTKTVVTPPVWTGLSEHHMPFGGTLSVDYQTFFAILRGLVLCLKRHGFRRVLIVNGHGGNSNACRMVAQDLALELGLPILATDYPSVAMAAYKDILEDQDHIMHACEAETSMMLALAPELVDASDLASCNTGQGDAVGFGTPSSGVYRWRSFTALTPNGVKGNPTRATAEKGERLLDAAANGLADCISSAGSWAEPKDIRLSETGGVKFTSR